jgi:hypothetical protein
VKTVMAKKWFDCGYFSLTRTKNGVNLVIKHVHYFLRLDEVKAVLNGQRGFTLVYEMRGQENEAKE